MPSPSDPVAFSILGLDVRWYALFMLGGVVAGLFVARSLAARIGLDPDWVIDAAPWVVLFSIVGARSYYVALRGDYFLFHPAEAFNIRLGGLAFHGALIAGTTAFAVLCRRARQPFHPTFLYESLFNLANAVLLAWITLRIPKSTRLRHGDVLAVYLITYGAARFLIERIRTDSLYLGPLPAAYWLSWVLIAVGSGLLIFLHRANSPLSDPQPAFGQRAPLG